MLFSYKVLFLVACFGFGEIVSQYEPTWDSLDSRPLPQWFHKAKIGIFVQWGVFSVPSFGTSSDWFWQKWKDGTPQQEFVEKYYGSQFTYQDFAPLFTTEFYSPNQWADLFQRSGAKYVIMTSKHGDGYALWPSTYSFGWNTDVGPKRDLLGELAIAVRKKQLSFGILHVLYEYYNPLFLADQASNWTSNAFANNKVIPELKEIVAKYKPDVIYSGRSEDAPPEYWQSKEFLAWLYSESLVKDVVVTSDSWGTGTSCTHGDFYTCQDSSDGHIINNHKWQRVFSMDTNSWGYHRNSSLEEIRSIQDVVKTLIKTISSGGNFLINFGATKEGTILPIFQERLLQMGTWLSVNGEAIYETSVWTSQNDTFNENVWFTTKSGAVYAILLEWPSDNIMSSGALVPLFIDGMEPTVTLIGNEETPLTFDLSDDRVNIFLPDKVTVVSKWAWVVKIIPF